MENVVPGERGKHSTGVRESAVELATELASIIKPLVSKEQLRWLGS